MAFSETEPKSQFETSAAPTVFVLDDDADIRQAFALLLNSVGVRARTFASARDFLEVFDGSQPGCLLLDMRLPGMTGLQLQQHLLDRDLPIPIIFVTGYGEITTAATAMRAGAVDYIPKPFSSEYLLERIHEAIERDRQQRHIRQLRQNIQARIELLTVREQEVMHLLVQGKSTKVIAARLEISQKTVDNHRAKVLEKMGADNVAQLAAAVAQSKLSDRLYSADTACRSHGLTFVTMPQ